MSHFSLKVYFPPSGQGRMDGAFCCFNEKEKMAYLEHLRDEGVVNIEMESLAFTALTHHAGIRSAVVCVTLLDRLKGDQVRSKGGFLIKVSEDSTGNLNKRMQNESTSHLQ